MLDLVNSSRAPAGGLGKLRSAGKARQSRGRHCSTRPLESNPNSRCTWSEEWVYALDWAVRRHYRAADPWRTTPSICTNLSSRKPQRSAF